MKQIEVTMTLDVDDNTDEELLVSSIADDVIKAYRQVEEIQYEWCEIE